MNKRTSGIIDCVIFLVVFFLIQLVTTFLTASVSMFLKGFDVSLILQKLQSRDLGMGSKELIMVSVLSSIATIVLFMWRKWSPFSRVYIKSKPWVTLIWVVLLSIGTILPSEWIQEQMDLQMPENMEQMFSAILKEPWGYAAIGILVPIAEEMVFRGAVLRKLLDMFSSRQHWIPIIISALVFGLFHGNKAQLPHAVFIGLILGWMYYRTGSIVPGVVLHWVNNTVAYLLFHFMPQLNDGKLIDLFHGSERMMIMGLVCSLCILLPSLLQLSQRLKRP